ncbi:MAG: DUF1893 domain-containing protein [Thermoplasmatales archaeon]|nr:MAG: DUF1893 domain-containing protein [Thermoplasmatales archaeon]
MTYSRIFKVVYYFILGGIIIQDIDIVREILTESEYSIVVAKNGAILAKKQGDGIRPIIEAIDELKRDMKGSTVGDRILGKASALLCVYAKVAGVYAPQATKTAIAVLIRAGIPGQTDELVPYIKSRYEDNICPFERMLSDIDSPEEAYRVLKKAIK